MKNTQTYPLIDIGKFIAALLVIAIHTDPLATYSELGNFAVTRLIGRIAVPFFFICAGYFLFCKANSSRNVPTPVIGPYVKKIIWIYLFSILLYLPLNWYKGDFNEPISIASLWKTIVFDGTFYHLWYLPALILGTVIVYFLLKAFSVKTTLLAALALYAVGLLGDSYFGAINQNSWLLDFYNKLFLAFDYMRNGLFFAPIYIALGAWISLNQTLITALKRNVLFLIVSFAAFMGELILIDRSSLARHDSMAIFLLPTTVFLFLALLHRQGTASPRQGVALSFLRNTSLWIYIFHPLIIIVVRGLGKLTGTTSIIVENSLLHYSLVTCLSIVVAAVFVWMRKTFKNTTGNSDMGSSKINRSHTTQPPINDTLRAYAAISQERLTHNLNAIRHCIPPSCDIMAVVKADAYGHGAAHTAAHLQGLGIKHFAVATLEEAIDLRHQNIRGEILILGYTPVTCKQALIDYHLTQSIIDTAYAQAICQTPGDILAHVKIDTGMNRLGERSENFQKIVSIYKQHRLTITGTYSHLSRADSLTDEDIAFTQKQIARFDEIVSMLQDHKIPVGKTHLQGSYGILNYPSLSYDLVRPGIALYGVLSDASRTPITEIKLLPVMSLYAKITAIKYVLPNESIGYGSNTVADTKQTIALVSIGYADGIPRNLSGRHCKVLVKGQYAEIIGSICMDQCIIDITNLHGIMPGDTVTLFGEDTGHTLSVDQWSQLGNTINNDTLSRIGKRIPKIFVS